MHVAGRLDAIGVPYMLTGSMASSLQGEPRSTHDIDLVVDVESSRIDALVTEFGPPRFYLSKEAVAEAVRRRKMFNLLEIDTGDKADFWVIGTSPFDQS